jgi:formylglycine-generating enzyme required for sulfatase activity
VRDEFSRTVGAPLVVADLAVRAGPYRDGEIKLGVEWVRRRSAGADGAGGPVLEEQVLNRSYPVREHAEAVLPLLAEPGPELPRVHEVLVRVDATLLGAGPPASFGSLRVRSDVAGAEVMLDGDFVGRTADDPPLQLDLVDAGTVEVSARDFSGRTARRRVVVTPDEIAETHLDILELDSREPFAPGLIPVGSNPQGFAEFWRTGDGALMVEIPGGEFLMGNDGGDAHERPLHSVDLSPFLIDKTEVTWRQFENYLDETGAAPPPEPLWGKPPAYPASLVSWQQASAFCEWAGGRLPSEAEWEKAARGTDGRLYQWGDRWEPDRCNAISGGPHRPEAAGSFPGCYSPYGVLDMAGSMSEWTGDWYQADYYAESPARDPMGPASGKSRVIRGGGWMTQPTWLRASYRSRLTPSSRRPNLGFRCVFEGGGQ